MSKINPPDHAMDEYMVSPPQPPHEGGIGQKASPFSQLATKITFLLFVLVFIMGGTAFYFYRKLSTIESNPQIQAQQETASLVAQISKIFLLPTNETPTIATVLDPAALKSQPFFANAQKNDKVLIYGNAREAILYDPALNKVINVAPLVIGNSQPNSASGLGNSPPASPLLVSSPSDNSSSKNQK